MGQTESVIISVPPGGENDRIREMAAFGWELQSHQAYATTGATTIRPDPWNKNSYVADHEVTAVSQLHFIRRLDHLNLVRLRTLEAEYRAIRYAEVPSIKGPAGCLILLGMSVAGLVLALVNGGMSLGSGRAEALSALLVMGIFYAIWLVVGLSWHTLRRADRAVVYQQNRERFLRSREILAEAASLTTT